MSNYQKGYSFEAQFVKEKRESEYIVLAERFHKSVGPFWKPDFDSLNRFGNYKPKYAPVDTWYLSRDGIMFFSQLKRNTMIGTDEMLDLLLFSMDMENYAKVQLVNRIKRKSVVWQLSNSYVR